MGQPGDQHDCFRRFYLRGRERDEDCGALGSRPLDVVVGDVETLMSGDYRKKGAGVGVRRSRASSLRL